MQLKRDTDYALRILLFIAKQKSQDGAGVTIAELSKNTAVPTTITSRLCRKLSDAGFLDPVDKCTKYTIPYSALKKTILDVICAVEGYGNLFAVFDPSTELYAICKDYFGQVNQQLENSLKSITVADLIDKTKKFS